jgi:hypothetical protein
MQGFTPDELMPDPTGFAPHSLIPEQQQRLLFFNTTQAKAEKQGTTYHSGASKTALSPSCLTNAPAKSGTPSSTMMFSTISPSDTKAAAPPQTPPTGAPSAATTARTLLQMHSAALAKNYAAIKAFISDADNSGYLIQIEQKITPEIAYTTFRTLFSLYSYTYGHLDAMIRIIDGLPSSYQTALTADKRKLLNLRLQLDEELKKFFLMRDMRRMESPNQQAVIDYANQQIAITHPELHAWSHEKYTSFYPSHTVALNP